jgi:hypothetical protein
VSGAKRDALPIAVRVRDTECGGLRAGLRERRWWVLVELADVVALLVLEDAGPVGERVAGPSRLFGGKDATQLFSG